MVPFFFLPHTSSGPTAGNVKGLAGSGRCGDSCRIGPGWQAGSRRNGFGKQLVTVVEADGPAEGS